jgi:N,N-dimethylformamidase beta subunit-like, C-terminal/Concanavalin A-like lectin/glucanases superfamily
MSQKRRRRQQSDSTETLTRRDFLKSTGAVASGSLVLGERLLQVEQASDETKKGIGLTGYTDCLSVQQGETIRFMVSSEHPQYMVDIVRLIHGDPNPKGPGFKEELIKTTVNGGYSGRKQELHPGSYVMIPDSDLLQHTGSFTLQVWIYPTTCQKGVQGILTKWSPIDKSGYGIFIEHDGSLALWIGDGNGRVIKVRTNKPLHNLRWYFAAATYEASTGRVVLYQEPVATWSIGITPSIVTQATQLRFVGKNRAPFLMGAYCVSMPPGRNYKGGYFNGKIESPRLFCRALEMSEIEALKQGSSTHELKTGLVAAWDFSLEMSSRNIRDSSPNRLHGSTVNMPMRAVTGHDWRHCETDFKYAQKEYNAIHFHDDDLDDAGWEESFRFSVPSQMRSGIYAARLRAGDAEDHIPFFVRPQRGTVGARIAYLIPSFTYLAYANLHTGIPGLLSLYDHHSDGSGVCYASRLRPLVNNIRPKAFTWFSTTGQVYPRHLCADLYFIDWMEAKGYQYDIITDEDLHHEGIQLLASYRVVVTGSHPEYYSERMLDGLTGYLANGGRLMYLGGNGFYWVTSMDPEQPHLIEIRRWGGTETWKAAPGEYHHSTTGELGGLWRHRGRPPQQLVGVGFTAQGWSSNPLGCGTGRPYSRKPGSFDARADFIFQGIEKDERLGDFEPLGLGYGAAGDEIDRNDQALGTPDHALLLATASGFSDAYLHVIEELLESIHWKTEDPLVRSDLLYFECPKGGAVFSVGSISWFGSLSHNGYKNNVSKITDNVLRRFASDVPL